MTKEEMENFINAPLNMELYEKFKIIYDKGYQDCKKEIKGYKSISISDSQKKLIEIYNEINESENAVCYLTSDDSDVIQSAIKALQEPCEDCISRKDLLKKCVYAPIAPVIKGDSVHYEDIVFARDIINAEPIQQELKTDILDKIRAEIESKIETIIGRYDSTTPMYDRASYKVERNKVREECIEIIDKYRQEG